MQPNIIPEFIRVPRKGERCPFTGLSRSSLYQLISPCSANGFRAPVKSTVLRKKGNIRGIRLILYSSLSAHLQGLTEVTHPLT